MLTIILCFKPFLAGFQKSRCYLFNVTAKKAGKETAMKKSNTTQNPVETLLKAEDVATHLQVCRSKAYQLLQTGEIKTVRIGRSVRVRPIDLAEFVNSRVSITA